MKDVVGREVGVERSDSWLAVKKVGMLRGKKINKSGNWTGRCRCLPRLTSLNRRQNGHPHPCQATARATFKDGCRGSMADTFPPVDAQANCMQFTRKEPAGRIRQKTGGGGGSDVVLPAPAFDCLPLRLLLALHVLRHPATYVPG